MQRLSASLESAPIVWKDGYPYFVHPVTDGVPRLEGEVLSAIVHLIGERVAWDDVDLILGIEAMGLPLTAPCPSSMTGRLSSPENGPMD